MCLMVNLKSNFLEIGRKSRLIKMSLNNCKISRNKFSKICARSPQIDLQT